jgi:hypothetical protein
MVRGDSHHAEKIHDQKRALYRNRATLSKSCHQTRYLDFEGSFHAFWRCFKRARASNSQAWAVRKLLLLLRVLHLSSKPSALLGADIPPHYA